MFCDSAEQLREGMVFCLAAEDRSGLACARLIRLAFV